MVDVVLGRWVAEGKTKREVGSLSKSAESLRVCDFLLVVSQTSLEFGLAAAVPASMRLDMDGLGTTTLISK